MNPSNANPNLNPNSNPGSGNSGGTNPPTNSAAGGTQALGIVQTNPDEAASLEWKAIDKPQPATGEALVRVRFAGVNRADTLQAQGHYPPPQGVTDVMGLEVTGVIEDPNGATKPDGTPWEKGEHVAALLSGGGYATHVVVPHGQLLPIPDGFSLAEAASIIEVACTVWSNLTDVAGMKAGDRVLLHGGGGGIGTFATQYATAIGADVAVTAGSQAKLDVCKRYGATTLINYKEQDFAEELKPLGGADIILDIIGAKYLDSNVKALAKDGRLVIIGMQGGVKGELNIGRLLSKRGSIHATGLRYRDIPDKARIVAGTQRDIWPLLANGTITHHIDRTMPVEKAAEAHKALLNGEVTGKIVLEVG
ncbi:NAD(P)H-quinone oxidoreductase [Corynebacterium sp. HMSC28B08]|uniref:NAD(P)H-quinone oxidoreductase n=1 Tax=Corynebacterium sp. HMSC28B08 TaxID=1581066 RepID=UPI0009F2FCFA|nr:NAD(P)H-quinone oxidoreductase [Corynebacterium sp. HMSC28B08]